LYHICSNMKFSKFCAPKLIQWAHWSECCAPHYVHNVKIYRSTNFQHLNSTHCIRSVLIWSFPEFCAPKLIQWAHSSYLCAPHYVHHSKIQCIGNFQHFLRLSSCPVPIKTDFPGFLFIFLIQCVPKWHNDGTELKYMCTMLFASQNYTRLQKFGFHTTVVAEKSLVLIDFCFICIPKSARLPIAQWLLWRKVKFITLIERVRGVTTKNFSYPSLLQSPQIPFEIPPWCPPAEEEEEEQEEEEGLEEDLA